MPPAPSRTWSPRGPHQDPRPAGRQVHRHQLRLRRLSARSPTDGQIPAAPPTNVDALIASGEDVMDNVVDDLHSLNTHPRPHRARARACSASSPRDCPEAAAAAELAHRRLGQPAADRRQGRARQGAARRGCSTTAPWATSSRESRRPPPDACSTRRSSGPGLLPGLLNDPATARSSTRRSPRSTRSAAGPAGLHRRACENERRPAAPPGQGQGVRPRGHRADPPARRAT